MLLVFLNPVANVVNYPHSEVPLVSLHKQSIKPSIVIRICHSFHVAKIGFGTYSDTGRIQRVSDDIICNNSYICTSPQWSNNNPDMGRSDN